MLFYGKIQGILIDVKNRESLKLLHTSDWHLGRTLYGKKRYAEFQAFLVGHIFFRSHSLILHF